MRDLESCIIEAGKQQKIQLANLYVPSEKAMNHPETGLVNPPKPVVMVIKDCATVARKYLPIEVYATLENPIKSLKALPNFNVAILVDFYRDVGRTTEADMLYSVMVGNYTPTKTTINEDQSTEDDLDDVYGGYGSVQQTVAFIETDKLSILKQVFGYD